MSAPADRPAATRMSDDELAAIERVYAQYDDSFNPYIRADDVADHIPSLIAEVRGLRAIAAAAEAHRVAYLAWHNWRPCAGMGHGHADRYAATRDALWAMLTPPQEGQ